MSVYKPFTKEHYSVTPVEVNQSVTLDSSSLGVFQQPYLSGSNEDNGITPDISGSHWNALRINFYISGSDLAMRYDSGRTKTGKYNQPNKFNNRTLSKAPYENIKDYYLNKFNSKGVVISIPQEYWGMRIQRHSFELRDNSTSAEIRIIDDGRGNLYSPNASISASSASPISSSENYVGNIFYNTGIITITDTGSHSTNNKYTSIGKDYKLSFKASDVIYQKDYSILVNTNDFQISNNPSSRKIDSDGKVTGQPINAITASNWSPHMTTIGFYDRHEKLVMVAKYPQPIKLKKDTKITFKIRQDY
tara:strand:- start:107 stop:1021 length:915 start_codon:yes stop_codon:yes gene_type:complete